MPFLLLVLGMQLAAVSLKGKWKAASVAVFLRLVVAAAVSFGLARALGLEGLTRKTMILESGMPSAILGVALARNSTRPRSSSPRSSSSRRWRVSTP